MGFEGSRWGGGRGQAMEKVREYGLKLSRDKGRTDSAICTAVGDASRFEVETLA
jgi:hypothetical protein